MPPKISYLGLQSQKYLDQAIKPNKKFKINQIFYIRLVFGHNFLYTKNVDQSKSKFFSKIQNHLKS